MADGYWQARQAMDRLDVTFSQSSNESVNQRDIFEQFAASLDDATRENAFEIDVESGDAPAALESAPHFIEAEYRVPYLAHATMEPMNRLAHVHDGRCELWLGTQNPLGFAGEVGDPLDIDADRVTVHNQYLGGGFGRRAFPDFAIQAARIAAESSYPVKLIWSREEDMRHDHYRQAGISRFRAALADDGSPLAWENRYLDKHDPEEAPHIPYAIANQLIRYTDSGTHVPWGFWRSVDHSLHAFFTESFIDEMAIAAGRDPYRYRRELLQHDTRCRDVLDLAAEKADWDASLPAGQGRGIAIQPLVRHDRRAGRRHRNCRWQAAGPASRLRGRCGLLRAPRRHARTDGKRHRLRADGCTLRRDFHPRRRRPAKQLSRLRNAAHERGAGGGNTHHQQRCPHGRRRRTGDPRDRAGTGRCNLRRNRGAYTRAAHETPRFVAARPRVPRRYLSARIVHERSAAVVSGGAPRGGGLFRAVRDRMSSPERTGTYLPRP
ncbi:MAG: molybdopterin cofactor-binding domain-containing protein [Woeseiaceae bacterium]|nr:molybdopterin cofactor-binding domain-containing protein [Woeseiaceae bacterium]